MQNKTSSRSGFFRLRVLVALSLCSMAAMLAIFSLATPAPAIGTLSTSNRSITYMESAGGVVPNPSEIALSMPNCTVPNSCSTFTLTIDPTVGTPAAGYDPNLNEIFLQWQWALTSTDYDIFIENAAGTSVIASNRSTADPSSIILPATTPAGVYKIVIALATGAPIAYTGTINLQPKPAVSGLCAPPANCTSPRYQSYSAGPGQADDAGEPSLGVDWNPNVAALKHDKVNTGGVAFFTSGPHEWRVNFDDCSSPAVNLWEDVSAPFDQQFVLSDPIGFVDHYTSVPLGLAYPPPHTPGRIFSIDLLGGQGDSAGAYSDVDGNSYVPPDGGPGGTGGPGAGPDHETLGGGPYAGTPPAAASYPATGTKNAIYYCSQDIAAEAQCSRSDDGGKTFGASVPIFTPTQCTGGIHGHVKVAPDGTVYVPNSSCGTTGNDGAAVSTDNGLTWTENNVSGSTGSQDPSVGVGQNNVGKPGTNLNGTNTVYLGWVSGDGHPHVAHSGDRGATWAGDTDVGAPFGITHAVFPVVVAGDDNRAAFAFLGTGEGIATSGNCDPYGATLNCKNIWHLYIATTYDGGTNWITIDSTPNDPVQKGTVCLQGTTCAGGRNLLDFNDFAIDSQGRGLVGYADGCVNCNNTFDSQSSSAHGTVTRQSGGRRLFAFFDPVEPAVPAAPQLVSATLQPPPTGGALVKWLEPDNGGSPITGYKVYRGTTSGGETFLANVAADSTKYLDLTPPLNAPNVFYYVTAVNSSGESPHCRELSLVPVGPGGGDKCTFPYLGVDGPGSPGTVPSDPTQGELTIQYVNLGEPFTSCTDNSLTFLMKVATLDPGNTGTAALPANSEWQILFTVKDTNGNNETVYVELDTFSPNTPANPGVSYGRRDACSAGCGTLDSAECTQGGTPPSTCPRISATYAPDGTIQFKLDVSAPLTFAAPGTPGVGTAFTWDAHAPGATLSGITGNTLLFVGVGAGFLETVQTTSGGSYTRAGNTACNTAQPIATLSAAPMSGAPPLAVTFDASASHEPAGACGSINSYTMNFGDGTPPVTQATPTFMHTYTTAGEFPARLTVSDSFGQVSTNVAQVIITVAVNRPPVAVLKATPTSGTAPLNVQLDGSGSSDPDFSDVITSYHFRFGDGSPDITQGSPIINHTYTSPGTYSARLVVTDSRGADSENIAEQVITAQSSASPTPTATATASPTATATATASPTATATATASPTATATATASPTATPTATATATATPTATPANVQLVNIAGRVFAQTGDKVGIAGFIISGSGTKRIIARAIGPSLNVNGKLQDPYLEIHDSSGSPPLTNDNWRSSQEAEIQQTGLAPTNDHESAIVKRLPPGNYTAIIRGADNSSGIGVVELYDLSTSDPAELGNLSVRASVETGDNALFDGLILRGGTPKRVLFRALGPSVKVNGNPVAGALQDPTLELHDGNGGLMATNDNWPDAPNAAEIQATGLAPPDNHESAILMPLSAGNYTTIVRGVGNTTGIGLAEAYKLNN